MPLAVHRARVAGFAQHVSERLLPLHQTPAALGSDGHAVRAGADGVAAGQQPRARRRALRLRGVVRQAETLPSERVDPLCPGAAKRTAAVTAQLTEAEVVDMEEEDVRPPSSAVGPTSPIYALARHSGSLVTPTGLWPVQALIASPISLTPMIRHDDSHDRGVLPRHPPSPRRPRSCRRKSRPRPRLPHYRSRGGRSTTNEGSTCRVGSAATYSSRPTLSCCFTC